MIKDTLDNIHRYSINVHFENFKKFLKESNDKSFRNIEKPLKAIPLEYTTGEFNLSKFENHQKFIDIHYIVRGEEQIGLNVSEALVPNMEYDTENDYQLFDGIAKEVILLKKGEFLLLFPGEAHVTAGAVYNVSDNIEKIVFKVPF
jgi:biofilm protein TabA